MKKIIFILFLLVSSLAYSQIDTTIKVDLSSQQLSTLYSRPISVLSPPKGYAYYVKDAVIYVKIDAPYSQVNVSLTYNDCKTSVVNFMQILSMKQETVFRGNVNGAPSACHLNRPLYLTANSNPGNGVGQATLFISYYKIKLK